MQGRRRGRRGQVGGQVRASEGAVLHWSLADMRVACHHTAECRQPEPLTGQGRPAVGACGGRCRRHLWRGGQARDQSAAHSRDEINDPELELALCIGAGAAVPKPPPLHWASRLAGARKAAAGAGIPSTGLPGMTCGREGCRGHVAG